MVDSEKYARPPIIEATIEIRLAEPLDDERLERLRKDAAGRYAHAQDEVEFEFRLDPTQSSEIRGKVVGGRFMSSDAADILLVRRSGPVVARTAPYAGWGQLKDRALDEFRRWSKVVGDRRRLSRLGVRYQNRIDIPGDDQGRFAPDPYVTVLPPRPAVLAGAASGFVYQLVECPVGDYMVNLAMTIAPSPLINHVGLVIDIDAYSESISSNDDLRAKIDGVRDVKNAVFESVITDATRALMR